MIMNIENQLNLRILPRVLVLRLSENLNLQEIIRLHNLLLSNQDTKSKFPLTTLSNSFSNHNTSSLHKLTFQSNSSSQLDT